MLIDAEGYDSLIVTDLLKNSNLRPIIIFEYIHTEFFDLDKLNILLYEKKYKLFTVQENLICIPKEIELKLLI